MSTNFYWKETNGIISSMRLENTPTHDRLHIWNRGGKAGTLTLELGDGLAVIEALEYSFQRKATDPEVHIGLRTGKKFIWAQKPEDVYTKSNNYKYEKIIADEYNVEYTYEEFLEEIKNCEYDISSIGCEFC